MAHLIGLNILFISIAVATTEADEAIHLVWFSQNYVYFPQNGANQSDSGQF